MSTVFVITLMDLFNLLMFIAICALIGVIIFLQDKR